LIIGMQDLLPHYERELAFLRSHAEEFGRRYPRIAGRLAVGGEVQQDPHVERMIQAFALLTSRIHKRLDDDFPLFAQSFLDVLYPHYLRPVPSSSIACFDVGREGSSLSGTTTIPRGTSLHTRTIRGVACRFQTTSPVRLVPARLVSVGFRGTATAPVGTDVPRQAMSTLSLQFELIAPQASWATLDADRIRLYIDGDPSVVTALREAMSSRVLATMVQTAQSGAWSVDTGCRPRIAGFQEDEALITGDARSHAAYRLLTEYFAFPEKFNFVDLPLPAAVRQCAARNLSLHLCLGGLPNGDDDARLLEVVGAANLLMGCTPVTNLFATRADPIRMTQTTTTYPVLPDGRRAFGHEVYAIDRVYRVQQSAEGESIQSFKPFYSLQHDDLLQQGEDAGRYWFSQRNMQEGLSPGYETELGLVDLDFDPGVSRTDTLSIDVRATNRDLPCQMSIGNPGGDLFAEGGGAWREIRMLRRPTSPYRIEPGKGMVWRLISQLSLNHLSLTAGGIDGLKEMLRLYDLPRSRTNQRLIDGLVSIDYRTVHAFLDGEPFATLVRGIEIRLTVDPQSFVGAGLDLFAETMSRFFALYVHINQFTQLKLLSSRSGEVLVACARRTGEHDLL
jgi:type VI secretion system protein ImpG